LRNGAECCNTPLRSQQGNSTGAILLSHQNGPLAEVPNLTKLATFFVAPRDPSLAIPHFVVEKG